MYAAIEGTVREILPVEPRFVVPVLGTLWLFIGVANLAGLVPGMKTPTADLNTTFALALVSYAMTHVVGIGAQGLRGYLAHYAEPTWLLLPFHLIAEATRTVALAVRLFGNMLSGDMVAVIILGIAGLLVPIPFEMLHIVIGLIQAYIFGMLTLVFIAGGIGTHTDNPSKERDHGPESPRRRRLDHRRRLRDGPRRLRPGQRRWARRSRPRWSRWRASPRPRRRSSAPCSSGWR